MKKLRKIGKNPVPTSSKPEIPHAEYKVEIKPVVCDYGIFECNKLKLILNIKSNAELIKHILEEDAKHNAVNEEMLGSLKKSGYVVKKITDDMLKDSRECDICTSNNEEKDCNKCSCKICVM